MSVGRFSDYQVEKWLVDSANIKDLTLRLKGATGYFLALHYDNPDTSGAYASEIFGGTYSRVAAEFTAVDGRTVWNAQPVKWTGLPSIVITHIAGWDASINGNMLWYSSLDSIVRATAGGTWSIGAQTIALSIN